MKRLPLLFGLLLLAGAGIAAVKVTPVRSALRPAKFVVQDLVATQRSGHGGAAGRILLCDPMGLAVDSAGQVLITDRRLRLVWRVDTAGVARILAGTGRIGWAHDGPARRVSFSMPEGVAVARDGAVYVADAQNNVVLRIDGRGRAERVVGTGEAGFAGDGGPAGSAALNRPSDVRFDRRGNLYIADVHNHRVRVVDPAGVIRTAAGTGVAGSDGDGLPATLTALNFPWGIAIDLEDRLLIADSENHRIRRVEHDGTVTTLAGNGRLGFAGDGGPGIEASFDTPQGLLAATDGRLFIGDEHNHAVRVLLAGGTVVPFAGTGAAGFAEDGVAATEAAMNDPESIEVRPDGSVLVTDGDNGRVLEVTPDGRVRNFAGRGDRSACPN